MRELPHATLRALSGSTTVRGEVLAFRFTGASPYLDLATTRVTGTPLRLGASVGVQLDTERVVAISGRVTDISRRDHGWLYRVSLGGGTADADPDERRTSFRIQPAATAPVRIRVLSPELSEAETIAHDLSVSSVCFMLPLRAEAELAETWRMRLELKVPTEASAFVVGLEVHRRGLIGSSASISGSIRWPSPHGTSEAERAVFTYVMHRQRECSRDPS
jgi:hypothetical protein